VRVLTDHGTEIPVMLRRPVLTTGRATIAAASQPVTSDARRARRYAALSGCEAIVNGEPTAVVNVSIVGAQMLSPTVLRPLQHVRIAVPIENAPAIRVQAAIAWSMFERSRTTGQTQYRVGIEFHNANLDLLEAFCSKHAPRV
jgi:hypothetical protein